MNASRLLQSLFRIPRGLWSALVAPVPIRRPVERAKPRSAAPAKREFQPTSFQAARPEIEPVALRPAAAAPAPAVGEAAPGIVAPAVEAEAPAGAKTMRSLDEVRADLARLRETAKERHAQTQQQARHVDTSFARTDFMDIPDALPMPAPRKKVVDPAFEATAFTDFSDFYPIPLLAR